MLVPDGNDGCAANSYPESANIDILKKKKRREIEEIEKRKRTAQNSKNCLARIRIRLQNQHHQIREKAILDGIKRMKN